MDNAKNMSVLLKAVHFKDIALVCATEHGLKVTVDDSKCVVANAYIQADLFRHYSLKEDVVFSINLKILLECLNIFGSSSMSSTSSDGTTAFELCYAGEGHPLVLLLEEGGVLTNCSLKTLELNDTLNYDFDGSSVVNKIIIRSECLKEVFFDLDTSSDVLEITMSTDKPHFRLTTYGNTGTYHWDYPKDSDMIEEFSVIQHQVIRYKMSLIRPFSKALLVSTRTSLRTDDKGFLSMQFMIKLDDTQTSFAEYFCAPDVEESSE
ncbi:hypothetical protein HELRODRAFT_156866 [Helobdella robusta]|uniref:Cell cycle checkpoint protein RAD1 n=1 Tax=Helobdella robusta TaxID=6412 RepID=T1EM22_HELRO|nr:hypothetical protein HELRODRAFT_156866 [Helobdella robusta]ESO05208.1 hypothetical protein HELRODRAFT_156866 [Helobdella robusta]